MRWTLRLGLFVVAVWLLFAASPYVALYRLSRAIEARDVAEIAERINFRTLRISLARQLVSDYIERLDGKKEISAINRQLAAEATVSVADPVIAQLLTPATLIDLLDDGWPQQLVSDNTENLRFDLSLNSLRKAWKFYVSSETRGFRMIYFTVPVDATSANRYRIQMRLSGFRWRLSGIDLPLALRQKLLDRLPRRD